MTTKAQLAQAVRNITGVQTESKIWDSTDMENALRGAIAQLQEDIVDGYWSAQVRLGEGIGTGAQDLVSPSGVRKILTFRTTEPYIGGGMGKPYQMTTIERMQSLMAHYYPRKSLAELPLSVRYYTVSLNDTASDLRLISTFPILRVASAGVIDLWKATYLRDIAADFNAIAGMAIPAGLVLPVAQLAAAQLLLFQNRADVGLVNSLTESYHQRVVKINDDYKGRLGIGAAVVGATLKTRGV